MGSSSMSQRSVHARVKSRSMGMKLIMVCGLALLLTLPALFVNGLVEERSTRAAHVIREISAEVGGQQTFLGPILAVPYNVRSQSAGDPPKDGVYLISPARASAVVMTTTEERRRSLFKVPVFRADLRLDGRFDLTDAGIVAPQGAQLEWNRAEVLVGVSDARGAVAEATVTVDGRKLTLVPAEAAQTLALGGGANGTIKLTLFGAKVEGVAKPNLQFNVTSALQFSGAQRIAVLAYGKTTHLAARGDWPNPGFDGGFLPVSRTVSSHGFSAEWTVPFIARGVRAEGPADTMTGLDTTALGVSFVEVADPYQSVNRSLKYIVLFLGLVFLTHLVFEVTTGRPVHPAQYILVGIAQIIFYLLLLSLAERVGFDYGFMIAGAATVTLLSCNAGWIFSSRLQGMRALAIFGLLYSLIYLLLRLEDNALLVGASASFLAVTAVMYFTRKIDWYGSPLATGVPEQEAPPTGQGGAA